MKLAHIALSVSSINKSIVFYGKHFGFKLAEKYQHKEAGLTIALIKKGNISLELFGFNKSHALPGYRKDLDHDLKTVGTKHFSLAVSDAQREYERLKRRRIKFATALRTFDNGLRYFFIKDPDGILVEIMGK